RTGKPVRNAVRGMFADDPAAARWLLINAEPLFQRDRHEVAEVLITFLDVTEMKCMQEEVRAERDLAESLLNTAQAIVLVLDPEGRIVRFNPYMEAISGYSLAEVRGKDWFSTFLPAEIQNRVRDLFRKVVSGIQTRGNVDAIVAKMRKDGAWFEVHVLTARLDPSDPTSDVIAAISDITERKRLEKVLVAQRDLALALSHTMGLRETLRLCLETAMNVSGMDCGGIYLRDEASGSLDFAFSVGLSHQFVEVASHYEADSGHTRLVMMGVPVYGRYREMGLDLSATDLAEGLRALAVIPMQHDGRVIGCVNVASHLVDEISVHSRAALEAIAGQVGSAISRSKTEETLSAHKQRLQWLASELSQTEDRERRHIAAYLHDEVGQSLAAVRVKLATWKGMKSSPKRRALLSDIEQLIDRTIDGTRTLTFELSPPILFELGLGPALEWFGETLCEKEGIAFEFLDEGRSGKIEEVLASALYRIVHELLMNAVKHAQARRVSVSLFTDESHIRLAVKDNGIGMERSRYEQVLRGVSGTYGLFSIRERLSHLGGSLEIESNPGEGTRVTVVAPVSYSVSSHEGDLA
ncbi:MAG: PAS domain S-box protein, partial [Candidatus Hydrogenedentes bacterium]|nr:PAS domain S-box protein [Candidatus Hydrogenedentota bacterium]